MKSLREKQILLSKKKNTENFAGKGFDLRFGLVAKVFSVIIKI